MLTLSQICNLLDCPLTHRKKEQSQYREALSYFWKHPTLREEIWFYIFPHEDPVITIPMYLHYVEKWTREEMLQELSITDPTFYRWVSQTQVPSRHREILIAAMSDIKRPMDPQLYNQALSNDRQWSVGGKSRGYYVSKKLAEVLNRDMRRKGLVKIDDYPGQNRLRLSYQLAAHAKARGWVEVKPGQYRKK